jgi:hypothetical protein
MTEVYHHMTSATIKSTLLIEIRNAHTAKIAEELVRNCIVPNEYLDKLLKIDMMNQLKPASAINVSFNNEQRVKKLIQLLQKNSIASTASFISNLYS